jgi:TonB family protein
MKRSNYFSYRPATRGFWLALAGSAGVHLLLVLALVFGGWLKGLAADEKTPARITALLRKGEPRPKNWLPRKPPAAAAPEQPKEVRPSKEAKPAEKKPEPGSRPTSRDLQKQMAQALAALAREEGSKKKEPPEGSPDGVEEGDSLVAQAGNEYLTKVYKAVKAQYAVPKVIPPEERLLLRATVVITIDRGGNLKDFHFEKRSGNSLFDSAIEAAVRRASPFPPPPAELADRFASDGLGLEFTP